MPVLDIIFGMNIMAVILFIIGIILLIAESLTPGFHVAGTTGIIFLIGSVLLVGWDDPLKAIWLILIVTFIILAFTAWMIRLFLMGKLNRHLVLDESQKNEDGYIGSEDLSSFIGKEGTVLSVLRPAGTADFDGRVLDVVSETVFIEKGKKVKVVSVEGRRVTVKEVEIRN